jgi:hypothetical protein
MKTNSKVNTLFTALLIVTFGCSKTESVKNTPVNSFVMYVNDQVWEPATVNNDNCYKKLKCYYSKEALPFYTIDAYNGYLPGSIESSENYFRLQIMRVRGIGKYYINQPSEGLNSYARLVKTEPSGVKVYVNDVNTNSSAAIIDEILQPLKYSTLNGVKGSFSGILYNEANRQDSIIIKDCKFTFAKVNWNDFCQCAE